VKARAAHSFAAVSLVALAFTACSPGEIAFSELGQSDVQVERGGMTVTVGVDPADSALADSLGWQGGVPGAEVFLLKHGTTEWTTALTDSDGTVVFDGLLDGQYRVFAGRTLTVAEAAIAGGVVRAFGDGRTVSFGETSEVGLHLLADRPGTLVISEISPGLPLGWEINWAPTDGGLYFEIYNNSDSVLYLDGKVFGSSYDTGSWTMYPCPSTHGLRTDPEGVYARWFLQFPGSGSDYPIGPGEPRLVAVEAIDHTPIHPTMPNLSNADFEIGGLANNPAVPDMLQFGPEGIGMPYPRIVAGGSAIILTEPFDIATLTTVWRDGAAREFFRVPTDKILEAVAFQVIFTLWDDKRDMCWPIVHRYFDRYEGGFDDLLAHGSDEALRSLQRKVLRVTADGRKILTNTNTTAYDFSLGKVARTPGWVP
jgi:hypothetical protein